MLETRVNFKKGSPVLLTQQKSFLKLAGCLEIRLFQKKNGRD